MLPLLDLTTFQAVLAQTILWGSERTLTSKVTDSLRSAELRPPFDDPHELTEATIQAVVEKRGRCSAPADHCGHTIWQAHGCSLTHLI